MKKESIGYVIPTLNSEKTLDQTLSSLLNQANLNIDIIVVDSGSVDQTLTICNKWGVKSLYAEPGNMYSAINLGISQLHNEWVGYINSDDYIYSDSAYRLIQAGNDQNSDIVYGVCDYIDFQGRLMYSFSPPLPQNLKSTTKVGPVGFAQQTAIFRRKVFLELNGFNEEYRYCADKDFFARAIKENYKFSFLPNPSVACFRLHKNQFSQSRQSEMNEESIGISTSIFGNQTLWDKFIFYKWRTSNLPYYLLRVLRCSLLSNKIEIKKSMSSLD